MARIVVQMGHVARTTGATGTVREQEFARAIAPRIQLRLANLGHVCHVIGADAPVPASDVFLALHLDGSTNSARHGASVGWPNDAGRVYGRAWKAAHQLAGYRWGFLPDNYTAALAGYYGFRRAQARFELLAEHGHATNMEEREWLFANLDALADAHVVAIGAIVGHPRPGGSLTITTINHVDHVEAPEGGVWIATREGGIFTFGRAAFYGSYLGLRKADGKHPDEGRLKTFGAAGDRTLQPRSDGLPGYMQVADDGAEYHFPIYDPTAPGGWRTT